MKEHRIRNPGEMPSLTKEASVFLLPVRLERGGIMTGIQAVLLIPARETQCKQTGMPDDDKCMEGNEAGQVNEESQAQAVEGGYCYCVKVEKTFLMT